ncbi:MAG TPA: NAD-dependent epimerase/dehydratase family protein, partial [Phycisphaerales bacterium]|nr:NAD-dependent epimerase/dehydratase family protein [Phycisphaerales bacterium]
MPTDLSRKRVVVTGGAGFLGGVVCEKLRQRGCKDVFIPRRAEYDLTTEDGAVRLYRDMKPDVVL